MLGLMDEEGDNRTPAELVRELRGTMSHDRFAAKLGTSRQTVIRWENGTVPVNYAEKLSAESGGKYAPERFNPRLAGRPARYVEASKVEELARGFADLERRIEALEDGSQGRRRGRPGR